MDVGEVKKNVYSLLTQLANQKGYITFDDILKSADSASLPIDEVDRLCELVISEGIIIRDNNEVKIDSGATERKRYDKSQLNYNAIYKRVVAIDQTLSWYVEQLKLIEPPQQGEEALLVHHAKEGNQFAKDRLISMFLKVALRIALWHHEKFGYPLDETIQDANVGLMLALEKVPLDKNVRFSTYAPWWIRQYITRKTQGVSRVFYNLPAHIKEKLILVIGIKRKHDCPQCTSLRDCSNLIEDICSQLSVDCETSLYYLDLIRVPLSLERVEEDDELLNDKGEAAYDIIEKIRLSALKKDVSEVMSVLKENERTVLELRYGLHDGEQKTLEEVGVLFGVTRERIRQIESRAFGKIRNPKYSEKLSY
ncbi:sigma-70 family RNA polymerase sigma factor [Brevibacillus borstelensis]|uniref:sigma-70 family RNA polymerase sigma factor n=1 Tax=Brevibacillus borstelensis TaxID=45462 RepID=UPI002E1D1B16|nr:sigma-70 family RNA polymerase sigma factor [Brevibacillus borstelensis]MED1872044.1 sigma-70 family RNA polymerase sigma factor [Brevibacillus borstelensis]